MPATVSAISSSSLYAGTTTATRLPSSIRPRALQAGAAGDRRCEAVPEERREEAEQEAQEGADHRGVALAAGCRLRHRRVPNEARHLDVLREREQLRGRRLLRQELRSPVLRVRDLADEHELVDRRETASRLQRLVQRRRADLVRLQVVVDTAQLAIEARDLRVDVARDVRDEERH